MVLCTEKGVYKTEKINNSFLNGNMSKICRYG